MTLLDLMSSRFRMACAIMMAPALGLGCYLGEDDYVPPVSESFLTGNWEIEDLFQDLAHEASELSLSVGKNDMGNGVFKTLTGSAVFTDSTAKIEYSIVASVAHATLDTEKFLYYGRYTVEGSVISIVDEFTGTVATLGIVRIDVRRDPPPDPDYIEITDKYRTNWIRKEHKLH